VGETSGRRVDETTLVDSDTGSKTGFVAAVHYQTEHTQQTLQSMSDQ